MSYNLLQPERPYSVGLRDFFRAEDYLNKQSTDQLQDKRQRPRPSLDTAFEYNYF